MTKLIYPAVFRQQQGAFTVSFPDIPSISTYGETFEQAYFSAEQTLYKSIKQSVTLPQPSDIYSIRKRDDAIVVYIGIDIHPGEEVMLNYNPDVQMNQPEWLDELESLYYIQ